MVSVSLVIQQRLGYVMQSSENTINRSHELEKYIEVEKDS